MSLSSASSEKMRRFPCPSCSANLVYDPNNSCLSCPFCGHQEAIPQSAEEIQERSYEDYLQASTDKMGTLADNALEVKCQNCGATVEFTPPQVAGDCPFCGTPIVAQPQVANPLVTPEGVLPFQISQQQADSALRDWLSSRWFAPNALKKMAYREAVGGIYLPYWTYDAYTLSYYRGERGEHYYETEYYTETDADGKMVQKSRQVQKIRWYSASGQVERWFDDLLLPATRSIDPAKLNSLEPWDLNLLRPYDSAFLSGFKAQRYEVELAEGFAGAKQLMAPMIDQDVRQDIGGDEQRVSDIQTHYSGITFKHILLPVYLGAYRFNQKSYQIMINARTGLVSGERPYSFWKIFFFVLSIIAIIAIIAILASMGKH